MAISEHWTTFGGFQVRNWEPGQPLNHLENTIYRISVEYDDKTSWVEKLQSYLNTVGSGASRGLVVGMWGTDSEESATEALQALVAAKQQLPLLEALFFGDITYEENEISWIYNTDHRPVFEAYPNLLHYGTRGGNDLRFTGLKALKLQTLIVQTGGMSADTVRDIMQAQLPELIHLELYLGTEEYGASYEMADLTPILDGTLFPKLKHLGLKNAQNQDEIAQVIVNAPVLAQLEVLDLSLGILTDEGAQALLNHAEAWEHLQRLNLQHHFITEEVQERFEPLKPLIDLGDPQDTNDDWRFVSIGE
ncbi:STM4015 family protein [Deinococcus roseus]|uniref:WGR domain-containing protein n=1 Tax=Deinococcus roseus TaxID=392414 RepID=A0ABQ2CV91_9DEIO|nr:STM4015 family protein [Deinococcus roseus]GGJ24269.1 WGR domain-containing protein [Deinococcus roseus]